MNKIFDVFVAIVIAVFIAKTIPVLACSSDRGVVSGAACSIKEINSKIQHKTQAVTQKLILSPPENSNLRPVKITVGKENELKKYFTMNNCILGLCKYDEIYNKLNKSEEEE